jgi:hypothetical protein
LIENATRKRSEIEGEKCGFIEEFGEVACGNGKRKCVPLDSRAPRRTS